MESLIISYINTIRALSFWKIMVSNQAVNALNISTSDFFVTGRIHKRDMSVEWCPTGETTGDFWLNQTKDIFLRDLETLSWKSHPKHTQVTEDRASEIRIKSNKDGVIGIKKVHRSVLKIDARIVIKIWLEIKHDSNNKNQQVRDTFNVTRKDTFRGAWTQAYWKKCCPNVWSNS